MASEKDDQSLLAREWDVLVCGGGPAGIGAAILAARVGARTLLVERYGRLGGMAVSGMVCEMLYGVDSPLVDEIYGVKQCRPFDFETFDLELAERVEQAGAQILLHAWAADTLTVGGRVQGVRLATKAGLCDVRAKITVDATGDGDIACFAGAEYEKGRTGDGLMQPMTIMFRIGGVDPKPAELAERRGHGGWRGYRFADGQSWKQKVDVAMRDGRLPENVGTIRFYHTLRPDEEIINATQVNFVDGTSAEDLTRAELAARRQARPILDFIRANAPGYAQARLNGMPAVIGVRETRRILGVSYLTREDLIQGRAWPDAILSKCRHALDIHNPSGPGQALGRTAENPHGVDEFSKPYEIPYGCLVPRTLDGLLVAGRCISGSHEAHASYRMIDSCFALGGAAGAAAALAARAGSEPRQVDVREVQKRVGVAHR